MNKKFFAVIALIMLSILFASAYAGSFDVAYAADEVIPTLGLESSDCLPYTFAKAFVEKFPNRSTGTDGESNAAGGLAQLLSEMGYTADGDEGAYTQAFDYVDPYSETDKRLYSQNVVGKKTADSEYTVVLGAHYDNLAEVDIGAGAIGGDGICDNGTGVGTLLAIAYQLKSVNLPFNLEIVFFGSEELGLFGSKHYVSTLSQKQKDSILLFVDLNTIGVGDYLYAYCDEVETEHADFLNELATRLQLSVKQPPSNRNAVSAQIIEKLPYSHIGLESDAGTFINQNINTVHLFSYNWDSKLSVEGRASSNRPTLTGTADDTIAQFEKHYLSTAKKQMNDAARLVTAALTHGDFQTTMLSSKANRYDYADLTDGTITKIVMGVLLALLIGLAVGTYFYLKKRVTPEDIRAVNKEAMLAQADYRRQLEQLGVYLVDKSAQRSENPFEEFDDSNQAEDGDNANRDDTNDDNNDSPFEDF